MRPEAAGAATAAASAAAAACSAAACAAAASFEAVSLVSRRCRTPCMVPAILPAWCRWPWGRRRWRRGFDRVAGSPVYQARPQRLACKRGRCARSPKHSEHACVHNNFCSRLQAPEPAGLINHHSTAAWVETEELAAVGSPTPRLHRAAPGQYAPGYRGPAAAAGGPGARSGSGGGGANRRPLAASRWCIRGCATPQPAD